MRFTRFLNSIIVGFQMARMFYVGDENATQFGVARTMGVERIVCVVSKGRESWQLYNLMTQFYVDAIRGKS